MKTFLGKSQRTKPMRCPNCGTVNDSAASVNVEKASVKPGDVSICIKCGHLAVFTERLKLRDPNDDEIKNMAGDPRLVRVMEALHFVRKNP